jgi:hypothetical protein
MARCQNKFAFFLPVLAVKFDQDFCLSMKRRKNKRHAQERLISRGLNPPLGGGVPNGTASELL